MVYEKRGSWCFRDQNGKLFKFKTKVEAEKAAGIIPDTEVNDGEEAHDQEEKGLSPEEGGSERV